MGGGTGLRPCGSGLRCPWRSVVCACAVRRSSARAVLRSRALSALSALTPALGYAPGLTAPGFRRGRRGPAPWGWRCPGVGVGVGAVSRGLPPGHPAFQCGPASGVKGVPSASLRERRYAMGLRPTHDTGLRPETGPQLRVAQGERHPLKPIRRGPRTTGAGRSAAGLPRTRTVPVPVPERCRGPVRLPVRRARVGAFGPGGVWGGAGWAKVGPRGCFARVSGRCCGEFVPVARIPGGVGEGSWGLGWVCTSGVAKVGAGGLIWGGSGGVTPSYGRISPLGAPGRASLLDWRVGVRRPVEVAVGVSLVAWPGAVSRMCRSVASAGGWPVASGADLPPGSRRLFRLEADRLNPRFRRSSPAGPVPLRAGTPPTRASAGRASPTGPGSSPGRGTGNWAVPRLGSGTRIGDCPRAGRSRC